MTHLYYKQRPQGTKPYRHESSPRLSRASTALALAVFCRFAIRHQTSHHITVCVTLSFSLASSDAGIDNMNVLDLELDLNVNVISPMWPENDFLDNVKNFTDTILTDELSFDTDINTNNSTTISNDFAWNFYYEDVRSNIDDTSNVLFQIDTNNQIDSVLESWSDTCSLDVLKDGLFELEIFNDVDNLSVPASTLNTTTATATATAAAATTASLETDHIIEWNRRRSLLYDKNEFMQSVSAANHEHRVKDTTSCLSMYSSSSSSSVDQRTFRCSVRDCDKTYYKASHLKSHMRRHSGVKPFACDWDGCKWRFSRSDELARHKRSHSGIKPYSCDLCDKAFSRSDHLSKHAKVHMKKLALYGTPIITKKCNYKYLTVNTSRIIKN